MPAGYTPQPLQSNVSISHISGNQRNTYVIDPDTVTADITLSADGMSGQALFRFRNDHGQYGPGLIQPGDQVLVGIGKGINTSWFNNPTGEALIFNGIMQAPRYRKDYGGLNNKYMEARAIDGTGVLQARMVNTAYLTLNTLAQGFPVAGPGGIVNDLVTNPKVLMAYQSGLNTNPLNVNGFTLTAQNVQNIPVFIPNITFQQISVYSALNQLATYANANFFVDANTDLHFFQAGSVTSPVILNDQVITSFDMEDDGTNLTNIVYVDGGTNLTPDTYQNYWGPPPVGVGVSSHDSNFKLGLPVWAQQFRAGNVNLAQLGLILSVTQPNAQVAVPTLAGEIRFDNGFDSPAGTAGFVFWSSPYTNILPNPEFGINNPATPGQQGDPFSYITVNATMIPGQKYWIVMYNVGDPPNGSFYDWYNSPSPFQIQSNRPLSELHWAFTPDGGSTWQIDSNPSGPFAFKTLFSNGVLAMANDQTSIFTYNQLYESAVTDLGLQAGLAANQLAYQYGKSLLGTGTTNWGQAKKKRFLRLKAFPPDPSVGGSPTIYPGQLVNVQCNDYGVNDYFTVIQLKYHIEGLKALEMDLQLQKFLY